MSHPILGGEENVYSTHSSNTLVITSFPLINTARRKCIERRLWEDSEFQVQQVEKIGKKLAKFLVQGGITTLSLLENMGPREIEVRTGRNPPFGSKVKEIIQRTLPRFSLEVDSSSQTFNGSVDLRIKVGRKAIMPSRKSFTSGAAFLLIGCGEDLLFSKEIRSGTISKPHENRSESDAEVQVPFSVAKDKLSSGSIEIQLIDSDWSTKSHFLFSRVSWCGYKERS